ncbi:SH3 domain-containing protein [Myxococcaceae bacterium JPH2]|nr:SH3 domain-containing protein [Myxococcaceae bacterium JPH2]
MLTLLLSLALGQAHPSLEYSAPVEPSERTLEAYAFTRFAPSEQPLYVGVDEANLRREPTPDAAAVTTLTLGSSVRVLKAQEGQVKVGDYVNTWYQVEVVSPQAGADGARQTGWLFGNTLTPYRFEADLDGDGEKEVATVVMSNEFKMRVRILEPGLKPPRRVTNVDMDVPSTGEVASVGGPVVARLVPGKKAGVELLQLDSHPDSCGAYLTNYVSYVVPGRKKGVLGKGQVALSLVGIDDAPEHSNYKATFQPATRRVLVDWVRSEDSEDGKSVKELEKNRDVYQYGEGVYSLVRPGADGAVSQDKP